jgi:hypothetical protein
VDQPAAAFKERSAKLLAGGAKGDAADERPVRRFQPHAHMRLADFFSVSDRVRRQRDHGLGIAGAERAGALDQRDEIEVCALRGYCTVNQETTRPPGGFHIGA